MKKSDQSSPSETETVEATAAAWLAQRDDGLNATQMAEFARWHEADPRHAAAFARLDATWALLGQLRDYRPEARVHPDRDLLAKPRPALVLYNPRLAVMSALAACLALVAAWMWLKPVSVPLTVPQYATTSGGYQRMTLEDGSVIELNADSEVRVNYTPAERRVRLLKGEAHFTVAKNHERPFWVEAGAVTVRAVGTAFNVRLDASNKIEVLVTEGRVEVDQSAVRQQNPSAITHTLIEAGQRIVIVPESSVVNPVVEKIALADMRDALSWQDSRLIFSDTPLTSVVEQFNKYNRIQIELADDSLYQVPVGGSWRAGNPEGFVRMLTADGAIVAERSDPDRIVLRKAP